MDFDNFLDSYGGILGAGLGAVGSILGGRKARKSQEKMMQQQLQYQREFAQNGISWRVADAKRAGLHPLYALGGSGATYSPMSTVGTDSGMSDAFSKVGQAISNRQTSEEKAMSGLRLENAKLNNDLLKAQINNINRETSLASVGQSPAGAAIKAAYQSQSSVGKSSGKVEGFDQSTPDIRLVEKGSGNYTYAPAKDRADWLQDLSFANTPEGITYAINRYNPSYGKNVQRELEKQLIKDKKLDPQTQELQRYLGADGWNFRVVSKKFPKKWYRDHDGKYYKANYK